MLKLRRPIAVLLAIAAISWKGDMVSAQDNRSNDQNRIIRVKPSGIAAKIGTAVRWESSWDDATKKSQASGKPIFWYVSTVPGTFMDRKVEIDRYLLAGPFSWPATIERLNRDFVSIRIKPSEELANKFDLKPYKFVEPGFVVIAPDQQVTLRVDHLTTLHPIWFDQLIAQAANGRQVAPMSADQARQELDRAWRQFAEKSWPLVGQDQALQPKSENDLYAAERLLLAGMFAFRTGDQSRAKEIWRAAAKSQPDSPSAWKAAAEAEGFGPFVRGFEVYVPLGETAMKAGIESAGSAAPRGTYTESELWDRGVDYLLGMQDASGGFFDSDYDFGGFDSLPNVHTAVTALVGMALLDSLSRLDGDRLQRVQDAIARAADYVCDERHLNLQDKDEILWAQAYRLRFLASLIQKKFGDTAKYQAAMNPMIKGLEQIQLNMGGWYHEYANPFVTATALTALFQAREAGGEVDTQKIERGLTSLTGDRGPNGAYPYSSGRQRDPGKPPSVEAGAGRLAICEMALWQWQKIDDAQLEKSARISLDNQKYLDVAYKYDNHTSTYGYGGFFFWYDMHARAEMIARIRNDEMRKSMAAEHRRLILDLPELDGCFVDSHELGRCYGTAMALLSLAQLQ